MERRTSEEGYEEPIRSRKRNEEGKKQARMNIWHIST